MSKIVQLLIIFCLLFGCNSKSELMETKEEAKQIKSIDLQYFQDPKTRLCFAYLWKGTIHDAGPALARVPCAKVCVPRNDLLNKKDLPKCIK